MGAGGRWGGGGGGGLVGVNPASTASFTHIQGALDVGMGVPMSHVSLKKKPRACLLRFFIIHKGNHDKLSSHDVSTRYKLK